MKEKEVYNYAESVKNDVKDFINEHKNKYKNYKDREKLETDLRDVLYDSDVTGSPNGSYTMSRWEAEENLCHNTDLLLEAIEKYIENGSNVHRLSSFTAEELDVLIRCYILGDAITQALDELSVEWNEEKAKKEKQS